MTRVGRVVAVFLATASLAFAGLAAPAAAEQSAPETGFGSRQNPMTLDNASGGLLHPVFRVFNPCQHFAPQSFGELTPLLARQDDEPVFPSLTRSGKARLAWLQCARSFADPFGGIDLVARCKSKGQLVGDSWGYHHGAGPIVLPFRNVFSRDDNRWQAELSFVNIGWVRADLTVWWLCSG